MCREKLISIVEYQMKVGGFSAYSKSMMVRSLDIQQNLFIKLEVYTKLNSFLKEPNCMRLHFPDITEIYPRVLALCLWEL